QAGYLYVVQPVMLNAFTIVLVAVLFNAFFAWRRYPAALARKPRPVSEDTLEAIPHENLVYALSQIDSLVDISEDDLLEIYELATGRPHPQKRGGEAGGRT
ncbi:MAG: hypothetical protein D6721_09105, partial [Gammaproteobacteria bacterium]